MCYLLNSVLISHGILLLFITLLSAHTAYALDKTASHENSNPVTGFQWTLEEDHTFDTDAGVLTATSLSLSFLSSHSPMASSGICTAASCSVATDPVGRDYVSVLPFSGHTMEGAKTVDARVAANELRYFADPTEQIFCQ